ncbi:hypothetical protein IWQ60_011179 [Tieghemiomyces parasiticus]|uniref:Coenzyme Q-binding protein COQ10 START domain-containing protein n=1 Tax=Tieghemiomyces parasiticus TaxID=78921 RepID=A0A9W7ZHT1_9FUNG|nr:hypothetical protein IWQ60_011179 [Tieghemiomyces parasiticus]
MTSRVTHLLPRSITVLVARGQSGHSARLSPLAQNAPRRTFLNLGSLLPDPAKLTRPQEYTEQQILPFSPAQVYKVVADVDRYSAFVPWCARSAYHRRPTATIRPCSVPEAKGVSVRHIVDQADLEVGFQAFKERYTSIVTQEEPWRVEAVSRQSDLFRLLRTNWEFVPYPLAKPDSQRCLVRFSIQFQFNSPIYAQVSGLFFDQVCKQMVNAFKQRCHDVYIRGK